MSFYLISVWIMCFAFASGAYQSMKVLKREDKEASRRLLMYWTVLGSITLYEYYAEGFIQWFPFYYLAKTVLLVMMIMPNSQVPTILFDKAVVPVYEWIKNKYTVNVKPLIRKGRKVVAARR